MLTPATLSDLSFVSCHPVPQPLAPNIPSKKKISGTRGGGNSFMTSLPIFLHVPSLLSPFQFHSFLRRPQESGATIYIVAWELRPCGPFVGGGLGAEKAGAGGEGQGWDGLCSNQRSGLQFPQTQGLTRGPPPPPPPHNITAMR